MQDKEKEFDNGEEMILKLFLAMCFDTSGKLKNLLPDEVKKGIRENENNQNNYRRVWGRLQS